MNGARRRSRGSSRRWVLMAALLAACSLVAACSSSSKTPADQDSQVDKSAASSNAISQADADACNELIRAYSKHIRDGDTKAALALYLQETTRTAETAVARDAAIADEDAEAFIVSETKPLWLEGEGLFPPGNDGLVMQSERERLVALSREHQLAVIMYLRFVNGESVNYFIVKSDSGFYLVP